MESNELPRLPIPTLQDTLNRYISRIEPLQDANQNFKTREKVFSADNLDILQQLQDKLIDYDKQLAIDNPKSSYIEQFWYDSYLFYEESVVLNVNPSFQLQDDPTLNPNTCPNDIYGKYTFQIKRASKLLNSILKFIRDSRLNILPNDYIKGKIPLSMDQYNKIFGSSRIPPSPKEETCHLQTDTTSHHIIVMYKSNFYWFDVLDRNNNPIFNSSEELEYNFYSILSDGDNNQNNYSNTPFGVFTTENRRVWSNIRDYIKNDNDQKNWKNLQIIDSALFVICLDDIIIEEDNDTLVKSMLCGTSDIDFENIDNINNNISMRPTVLGQQKGTCLNRWYDKLQLIVTRNGKAGINFEHTGIDGHTVLRLVTDIYTDSILSFTSSLAKNVHNVFSLSQNFQKNCNLNNNNIPNLKINENLITIPRKLEWKVNSFLLSSLHFAETRVSDLISQYEFATLDFKDYGAQLIKSIFKCSPDAFTQQIFQIAYFALYGKFETTYEPAMTKTFQNGRTEAIRSVTYESQNFVKSLFNKNVTDNERIDFLHEACKKHSLITSECSKGLGQDRHLYALHSVWKEWFQDTTPLPPIFKDSSWKVLNNNTLSTSNCGNPCLKNFGFGPVTSNGFGIGYVIRDKNISIVIASRHRQTKRFAALIEKSFLEIYNLFERTQSKAPTKENVVDQYLLGLRDTCIDNKSKSKPLSYLLGGYDYFDVSITG